MASKVNIVLDDDVKRELETLVEAGLRSRVINTALRKELMQIRRRQLSQSSLFPACGFSKSEIFWF